MEYKTQFIHQNKIVKLRYYKGNDTEELNKKVPKRPLTLIVELNIVGPV